MTGMLTIMGILTMTGMLTMMGILAMIGMLRNAEETVPSTLTHLLMKLILSMLIDISVPRGRPAIGLYPIP